MTDEQQHGATNSAIGARREQVAAFDRPERLNPDYDIRGAVAGVRDTPDLYKVYSNEWMIVFSSTAIGEEGRQEAHQFFLSKYNERVRDEDVMLSPSSEHLPHDFGWQLKVRLPNVKGEFKHRSEAEAWAISEGFDNYEIVARNSRDEYRLKEYGTKKIAANAL